MGQWNIVEEKNVLNYVYWNSQVIHEQGKFKRKTEKRVDKYSIIFIMALENWKKICVHSFK